MSLSVVGIKDRSAQLVQLFSTCLFGGVHDLQRLVHENKETLSMANVALVGLAVAKGFGDVVWGWELQHLDLQAACGSEPQPHRDGLMVYMV